MLRSPSVTDGRESQARLEAILRSRLVHRLVGVFLAVQVLFFASRHLELFQLTRNYAILLFCASETLQAGLYLLRRLPRSVSQDPFDWVVGIGGTVTPLFLIPGGSTAWAGGEQLVYVGVTLQILALVSLGRSFAIVAANRAVKTVGLYRLVRHPMYASYLPLFIGYVLFNTSFINIGLVLLTYSFLVLRIAAEEDHLSADPAYRDYMSRTKWRLLPLVY